MREVTIMELVNDLRGKTVRVESADIYGVNLSFSKARIEYNEEMNELSFVAGRCDRPDGIGGVGICIDDVVEAIRLEDDGSYIIEFNQYIADVTITKSGI